MKLNNTWKVPGWIIWALFFLPVSSAGQDTLHVSSGSDFTVRISPRGHLGSPKQPAIEYPAGSGKALLAQSAFWLSGDFGGKAFSAVHFNGLGNYWPGPLPLVPGTFTTDTVKWNRVFPMQSAWISEHRSNCGKTGYLLRPELKNWPTGEAGFADVPAPYVEVGSDSRYSGSDCDYPYIFGQRAVHTVYGSGFSSSWAGQNNSLPLELQVMYCHYDQFPNLLTARVAVINRSSADAMLRLSVFNRFALGDTFDNYLFTDVPGNGAACYNAKVSDRDYGVSPPAVSCFFLNAAMESSMYLTDNSNSATGWPSSVAELSQLTSGKWKNGNSLTFGSMGLDGDSVCSFVFSNGTDARFPGKIWNEDSMGNLSGERISLINSDKRKIAANSSMVFWVGWKITPGAGGDLDRISSEMRSAGEIFRQGRLTSLPQHKPEKTVSVYPLPLKAGDMATLRVQSEESWVAASLYSPDSQCVADNLPVSGNFINFNINLKEGVYCLLLRSASGNTAAVKIAVVQ